MTRTTVAALTLFGLLASQTLGQVFVTTSSTPQGDILRGGGRYLEGAGIYNYYTAISNSINLDTMIRANEYIYQSLKQDNLEKAARRARRAEERVENYNKIRERIENEPNQSDMVKGDALNALFERLTGPKISPSSFRIGSYPFDADMIRKIPFMYGPQSATIAMSRLMTVGKWPIALRGPEFAQERRNYERALDTVLELQLDRKTTRDSLLVLQSAVRDLFVKLDKVITPEKEILYIEAKGFLNRLENSKEMMKKKDVEMIIGEIDRYSGTTIHDLIVFMQKYNLRFAVPEIGDERATYPKLYAAMKQQYEELTTGLPNGR